MITVRPETLSNTREEGEIQLRYDLQTQFAELVDGSMRTEFDLTYIGDDLVGEDGRGLNETTSNALNDIDLIIEVNPELYFEKPRRVLERQEFEDLLLFAEGQGPNTKVVVSEYPEELLELNKDMGGYNATRKQAMLRVYTRSDDGDIKMYSRSLDGSNRLALECIYDHLGSDVKDGGLLGQRVDTEVEPDRQATLIDELTDVYDKSLTLQFGGEWYAGRNPIDLRNTYDFVCRQQDIIGECLRLDQSGYLNRNIMYNFAATMNKRFKQANLGEVSYEFARGVLAPMLLQIESEQAGIEARDLGMSFSACGDTLSARSDFESTGFGNSLTEDHLGPLVFKCGNGHTNTRPRGEQIPKCIHCGISVKCKD